MKPMKKLQEYFIPYTNEEDFFNMIQEKIVFEVNPDDFRQNIERKIWPLLCQTSFFIVEDTYTETEWKDMIAEHYIHTKYTTIPTVVRVHLFTANEEIKESYLGCFTLRKINNPDIIMSFIYPNWNVLKLDDKEFMDCYLITAKKRIHIYAEEIEIQTTPYFVQDGIVTSCAHASMVMLINFLNLKFGYKRIRVKDINQSYINREKLFPTKGLLLDQVMEVLTNNGINIEKCGIKTKNTSEEEQKDIEEQVKSYLRSGFPVMLGIENHLVLIVGFKENTDEFLFLDDSGALIHSINKEKYENQDTEYDSFISICSWKYIFKTEKNDDLVQLLLPMHERIYSDCEDVSYRCSILERNIGLDEDTESTVYKIENKRFFIVDNVVCKKFVNENIMDREFSEELLNEFICQEQPHYLWCYEFEYSGQIYIIFINTTYNIESDGNNIYINKDNEPFHIEKHFQTMFKVKTQKYGESPMFNKKREVKKTLDKSTGEKVRSRAPMIPKTDVEEALLITKVERNNDIPKKKSSKNKGKGREH